MEHKTKTPKQPLGPCEELRALWKAARAKLDGSHTNPNREEFALARALDAALNPKRVNEDLLAALKILRACDPAKASRDLWAIAAAEADIAIAKAQEGK